MQIFVDNDLYTIAFDMTKFNLVKNKIGSQLRFYAIDISELNTLKNSVNNSIDDFYINVYGLEYDSEHLQVKILTSKGMAVIPGKRKIGDLIIIANN